MLDVKPRLRTTAPYCAVFYHSASQSVVAGPPGSASSGNLLEVEIPGPHPRLSRSGPLGVEPHHPVSPRPPSQSSHSKAHPSLRTSALYHAAADLSLTTDHCHLMVPCWM